MELGVSGIVILAAQRSVVKPVENEPRRKHCIGAALFRPRVNNVVAIASPILAELNDTKMVSTTGFTQTHLTLAKSKRMLADWTRHHPAPSSDAVMVGPEGGFSELEEKMAG